MRTTHGTTRSALNDPRPRHFYSPPFKRVQQITSSIDGRAEDAIDSSDFLGN